MLFRPRHLNTQLVLIVSIILIVTATISGWLSGRRQTNMLTESMREHALSLTRSIGESCAHYLVLHEYAGLESLLMASLRGAHILRLQVAEPDGLLVGDVENGSVKRSLLLQGIQRIEPPADLTVSSEFVQGTLVVWQPITAGPYLGWLKATYDLSSIRAAQVEAWKNTLLLTLCWVAGSAGLLILVLRPLVRTIGRLTDFARRLDELKGEEINVGLPVREIVDLAASLNGASRRIYQSEQQLIEDRERLRLSYEYIQQLFAAANVMIVGLDEAGQVRLFNRAAERITGYGEDELRGVDWFEAILPDERYTEVWRKLIEQRCGKEEMPTLFEQPLRGKEGEKRFIAWQGSPIQAGKEIAAIAFGIDCTERVRAEEEILRLNERFALASSAAGLGVWDWDIRKNELVWDDQMYALHGTQKEDFAGAYEAWLQMVHPEDRARCDAVSERARRGEGGYDTEFRVVWADGSIHHLRACGQVIRDEDGTPLRMTGVNYDITVRKQAEEALYALNETLEQRVAERTAQLQEKNVELEQLNKLFVGRELRMAELKEKIRQMEGDGHE